MEATSSSGGVVRVLFLASSPSSRAPTGACEQARAIEHKVLMAEHRDAIELITKWNVRPDDVLQALNQHAPHVVHFAGHGETAGLVFSKDADAVQVVDGEALQQTLHVLGGNVRLVVLTAGHAAAIAERVVAEVECAIGVDGEVADIEAPVVYAAALYRAVAFGRSVQRAHEQGLAALALAGQRRAMRPVLVARARVDPDTVWLVGPRASDAPGGPTRLPADDVGSSVAHASSGDAGARGVDVLVAHGRVDGAPGPSVVAFAEALEQRGLRVWLDALDAVPGEAWHVGVERVMDEVRSVAVVWAGDGEAPWDHRQVHAFLSEMSRRGRRLVPVVLPSAPPEPALPSWMRRAAWVDLRGGLTESATMDRLVRALRAPVTT